MASTNFVDRSDFVLKQMGTNCAETMESIGKMLVEAVQEKILYGYNDLHGNPPHTEIVDTGYLFEHIEAKVERVSQNAYTTVVGTNTPYAKYVHEGTYKLKGRPFITDAVMERRDAIINALFSGLSNGF